MLKRNIVVQAFVVVVVLLTIGTNTFGALIDMTFADQHVFGETGYKIDDPEYIEDIDLSLEVGLGNFDLEIPLDNFGVSISPLLHSRFLEDQTIEVIGSSHASAEWGKAPLEADDIHGGGVSEFALYFARESSPVYFQVNGQINFDMESHTSDYPEMLAV